MSFVNLSLLLGGVLVSAPIILHLAMRQRPKTMVFPAVQFLRQRRESNSTRLRLRHWLLLFLRCLAIAAVVVALARPRVASARVGDWVTLGGLSAVTLALAGVAVFAAATRRSKAIVYGFAGGAAAAALAGIVLLASALGASSGVAIGDRQAPGAAVLVFDTAPRMQYRNNNQTRLEAARDTALWLLRQFPFDSQVAVLEARPQPPVFSLDLAAAKKAIERLAPTGVPRPLTEVLIDAIELAKTSELKRREVFVFTDLSQAAWPSDDVAAVRRALSEAEDVALYVIDVGAEQPMNVGLGPLSLSGQTLTKNSPLQVDADVFSLGMSGERTVELLLEESDASRPTIRDGQLLLPAAHPRGREIVTIAPGEATRVSFQIQGLELGVHHGVVRLTGQDGLPADDERHFTIDVRQAWPVLVVEPRGGTARFLVEAIAPYELRQTGQASFECHTIEPADLLNQELTNFAAVCLLDPGPLTPDVWQRLHEYCTAGGSLGVFLGHNADPPSSFHDEAAQAVLPGRLERQWRTASRDVFLAPSSYDHPALVEFRSLSTSVPWSSFPVFRYWQIAPLDADARALIPFNQANPAVIEQPIGKGRVVTFATPISDPARPAGRQTWNELPTGENAWPYFVLVNELMRYLVESDAARLNYATGEIAALGQQPQRDPEIYQLFTPNAEPQEIAARGDRLSIRFTENPGAYRLKGNRGGPVVRGFSVNLPPEATELRRVESTRLDEVLGEDRYQFARDRDQIELSVGEARAGREFYPTLLVLLAGALAMEQLLANRFYRRAE